MSPADPVAAARLASLDLRHRTTGFFRRLDAGAKARAQVAFAAYDAAVRAGDTAIAEAARGRFNVAAQELKGGAK